MKTLVNNYMYLVFVVQVDLILEHNDLERNVKKLVDEDFPSLVLENQKRIESVGKWKPLGDAKEGTCRFYVITLS